MSCIAATMSSHGADFVRATVMLASLEKRNMTAYYECTTCGVVTKTREQICKPKELESKHSYCGTTPEEGEMCQEMKGHLAYVCGSCGRPAEQAELLCNPLLTG